MEKIIFTVTNDLSYDQRMNRICDTLAGAGYRVTLVGCSKSNSVPLEKKGYVQKRLFTFFRSGFGFYAEYNIRLFIYLFFSSTDAFCSIDLDTAIPVWLASAGRRKKCVMDAHEYFTQQKEIISRPAVHRKWLWIEKTILPKFIKGYTVSASIAGVFSDLYGLNYEIIRNMPLLKTHPASRPVKDKIILYQGAVNEARGLEFLIPCMKKIDAQLIICGDGNFMTQLKELIRLNNLQEKVLLMGSVLPDQLEFIAGESYLGLNLVENIGLNQYYSLANKFFDYIHSGLPQVTMNFPEYTKINNEFEIAVLIDDLQQDTITGAINSLLKNTTLYSRLHENCIRARDCLNWQEEEIKLVSFYHSLFKGTEQD